MKVVIAIDSLKGSLSSIEAGTAIKNGIERVYGDKADVIVRPLADGGEGTVEALAEGMNGELKRVTVKGPMGKPTESVYAVLPERKTAVIEMASAAGIVLVPDKEKNPLKASTYGVGETIKNAVKNGMRSFIIGIGGSATNDCGTGMLTALGWRFLDESGNELEGNGENLVKIKEIDDSAVMAELKECNFKIACDVNNPLCGDNGCSNVYGPQKGATEAIISYLDEGCKNFAEVTYKKYGIDNIDFPGAGAAGGLGYAFSVYLNSELKSGIDIVLEETELESYIEGADYVITGEGRIDFQTAMGKGPMGVARLGKKHGAVVIGFAGCITEDADECNAQGMDAFFSIIPRAMTLEEAVDKENSKKNMAHTAEEVFRLIKAVRK